VVRLLALPIVLSVLWPAQVQPPTPVALPDRDAFVKETRANLERSQREQNRFSYEERRTELHTNPFGRLGTGGVVVYEVTPLEDGTAIARKLIARDGKPVPDAKVERRNLTPRDPARTERRTRRSGLEDSIAMLEFAVDRRETVRGRNTIVVTFKPRPDARPETSQGRIARVFTGSVWVDEAQKEVTRIEATTIDDISVGLGVVARLNEGTKATMTREEIDDSIWLPTSIRFTGQGRALLFRRLNVDQRIEWFDYRRVN
jgi:hypothetical protein